MTFEYKIVEILDNHPEMTLDTIKRIPELLDDPVLVLKSLNKGRSNKANTRLVMFGTVKAANGSPVLTVLDLRPVEGGLVIDDMQKVNSAYTKRTGANFVVSSEVLHADKKRTIPLLRSLGLQYRPSDLLQSGSIGNISYSGTNVNISGIPFSSVMHTKFSMKDGSGTVYNRTAILSDSTVDRYLKDYASESSPKYAQAYIAYMRPLDYLSLTTSRTGRIAIEAETQPLDAERLANASLSQPIQLRINHESGDVEVEQEQFNGLDDSEKLGLARKIIKQKFLGKVIGIENQAFEKGRGYGTATFAAPITINGVLGNMAVVVK